MTSLVLYRIAAGLLVFFAIGHTKGLLGTKNLPAEAKSVRDSMDKVQFPYMGVSCSWGEFYLGFGLLATVFLLFSAAVAWVLGDLSKTAPNDIKFVAWVFVGAQLGNLYLSWRYFFKPPAVVAALVVACSFLAVLKLKTFSVSIGF